MPSGAKRYRDAHFLQEIIGAHHVVATFDLMVDVLDSDNVRWKQRDRMMHLINAQERGIADPIGDAGVADLTPELIIAVHVGGAKADMTKACNPGISASTVAFSGMRGPIDEFNSVTAGIPECNKALDAAGCGLVFGTTPDGMAKPLQLGRSRIKVVLAAYLKRDRLLGRVPLEIAKRLLTGVGLEANRRLSV